MKPISFKRHRFPADVIRYAVWLYFRFSLSFRDVEELLAQRGIEVSYETIRCWTIKFGPLIARRLKTRRCAPSPRWHLDEMVCWIGGKRMYLWRAVDDEGEVLDLVVQRRRDTEAALRLLKRLLHNRAGDDHDRRAGVLRRGARPARSAPPAPPGPAPREQSSGELPSSDPTTRTPAAGVQIPSFSPEIPDHTRGDLQHLQHPAPFDQETHPSPLSRRGGVRLGGRGCLSSGRVGRLSIWRS